MGAHYPGYSDLSHTIFGSAYTAAICKWIGEKEPYDFFNMTHIRRETQIAQTAISGVIKKLEYAEIPLIQHVPEAPIYGKPYTRLDHRLWVPLTQLSAAVLEADIDWAALDADFRNGSE